MGQAMRLPAIAIRAEIVGDDTCSALGTKVRAYTPILALCRALVAAGHDQRRPLHAYRGDVLALTVRSIGEAARLEISGEGTGFRPARKPDAASPVRGNEPSSPKPCQRGTAS
jgi:hypothetical protein